MTQCESTLHTCAVKILVVLNRSIWYIFLAHLLSFSMQTNVLLLSQISISLYPKDFLKHWNKNTPLTPFIFIFLSFVVYFYEKLAPKVWLWKANITWLPRSPSWDSDSKIPRHTSNVSRTLLTLTCSPSFTHQIIKPHAITSKSASLLWATTWQAWRSGDYWHYWAVVAGMRPWSFYCYCLPSL